MGFENLRGSDLDKTYQGLMGLLNNQDPSEIEVPNLLTNVKQNLVGRMVANVFDRDQSFAPAELTEDNSTPPSPRDRLMDIARRAISKTPLSNDEIYFFHILLNLNDADNVFDNEITEDELAAAQKILDGYDAGKTTLDNRAASQLTRDEAAAREEELRRQAQAEEQVHLTESFGLSALGYDGTRGEKIGHMVRDYQEPLSRMSESLFGHHMNSVEILQALQDPNTGPAMSNIALSYIVKSGDYSDVIMANLDGGSIEEAQALLNLSGQTVDINGAFTASTKLAAETYFAADHGLGDANFSYLSNQDSDALYANEIDTTALTSTIESGGVPILPETLGPMLAVDGMTMEDLLAMPESQQYLIVATYLSDEHNFQTYDAAMKERGMEDLTARLDTMTVVADPVFVAETGATHVEGTDIPADTNIVNHNIVAGEAAETHEVLVNDSQALDEKLAVDAETFDRIIAGIRSDMPIHEDTPPEVSHMVGLIGTLEAAEAKLTSYQMFSTDINSGNNDFGPHGEPVIVEGAVGAPYSPFTDILENRILDAQNDYAQFLVDLSPEQKVAIVNYIQEQEAIANDPVVQQLKTDAEKCNWFQSTFMGCVDPATVTPEEESAGVPLTDRRPVSSLDM